MSDIGVITTINQVAIRRCYAVVFLELHSGGCSDQNALTYKTRYGDSFESIASIYRIKVDKLMDLNPSIRFVRPGMQIHICPY